MIEAKVRLALTPILVTTQEGQAQNLNLQLLFLPLCQKGLVSQAPKGCASWFRNIAHATATLSSINWSEFHRK